MGIQANQSSISLEPAALPGILVDVFADLTADPQEIPQALKDLHQAPKAEAECSSALPG